MINYATINDQNNLVKISFIVSNVVITLNSKQKNKIKSENIIITLNGKNYKTYNV